MQKPSYPVLLTIALASALLFPSALSACGQGPERDAFRWELAEDASPQPNGMLLLTYEEPRSLRPTHVTYHRVLEVLPKPALTAVTVVAGQTAVEVDGTLGPLVYVIISAPLFYGTDLDEVGLPRRVWFDAEEDGLNGNEVMLKIPSPQLPN